MIHIKYKLKASLVDTSGIGLFSEQDIKAGETIYTPSPLLDVDITKDEFNSLSESEKFEIKYYGYFNNKSNKYHVAFDAIRVLNHADKGMANVTQDEDMVMTALRDIKKGEEILQDYNEIYPNDPGNHHFTTINSKQ